MVLRLPQAQQEAELWWVRSDVRPGKQEGVGRSFPCHMLAIPKLCPVTSPGKILGD